MLAEQLSAMLPVWEEERDLVLAAVPGPPYRTEDGSQELDTEKVWEAMRNELGNFQKIKALQKVGIQPMRDQRAKFICTRWLLTRKPSSDSTPRR